MTKKEKILNLFNDSNWVESAGGYRHKTITSDMLYDAGLSGQWEYGEQYNDIAYARRIFNKMGYSVMIGSALFVVDKIERK